MNWILQPAFPSGARIVDLEGDRAPTVLNGDFTTVATAVYAIVPNGERLTVDVTGVGLAMAEQLHRLGMRILTVWPQVMK